MVVAFLTIAVPASAGSKDTERPSGILDTAITPLSGPGQIPIVLAVDIVCRLSHLGLTVGGTDREVVLPAGPPSANGILPIYITVERITYVAATATNCGRPLPGPATRSRCRKGNLRRRRDVRRGTGRFAGASGQTRTVGGSLVTNTGRLTTSGNAALLARPRAPEPNDPRGRGSSSADPTSLRRAHHQRRSGPSPSTSQPRAAICSRTVRSTM